MYDDVMYDFVILRYHYDVIYGIDVLKPPS